MQNHSIKTAKSIDNLAKSNYVGNTPTSQEYESYIPEDKTLRNGPCENPKSYKSISHTEEMKAKLIS
jgi:hypothetical protein